MAESFHLVTLYLKNLEFKETNVPPEEVILPKESEKVSERLMTLSEYNDVKEEVKTIATRHCRFLNTFNRHIFWIVILFIFIICCVPGFGLAVFFVVELSKYWNGFYYISFVPPVFSIISIIVMTILVSNIISKRERINAERAVEDITKFLEKVNQIKIIKFKCYTEVITVYSKKHVRKEILSSNTVIQLKLSWKIEDIRTEIKNQSKGKKRKGKKEKAIVIPLEVEPGYGEDLDSPLLHINTNDF